MSLFKWNAVRETYTRYTWFRSKFTIDILGFVMKSKKKNVIGIIDGIFEYKDDVVTETTTAAREDFYFEIWPSTTKYLPTPVLDYSFHFGHILLIL